MVDLNIEESSSRGKLRFYHISMNANKDSAKRGRRELDRCRADAETEVRGRLTESGCIEDRK